MDENMSFVHLHTHSEYSPLDGLSKIAEIAEQVKKNGQNAFAITDHGTCAGHPQLQKVADSFGLKPIFGIEAYFVNDRIVRPLPRPAVKEFATKREHEIAVEKQKEQQFQHAVEKKRLDRIEETRVERAKRLGLDKGTNVDLDC